MLVLNDLHISFNRQGGTTPTSRESLRTYLLSSVKDMINSTRENHICVLGDLFDGFDSEGRDWVAIYLILQDWLSRPNGGQIHKLTLVAGNHDWSQRALKVSSFEMLCKVLVEQFGGQVQVIGIDQWAWIKEPADHQTNGDIALAHCSNQDVFNAKLSEVLFVAEAGTRVLLHANYQNHWATQSDHSLNVSEEQALQFCKKGAQLFFAHEHQSRSALAGRVTVFGCQWPTSVSDCLNNDVKYAHIMNGGVEKVETWSHMGPAGYAEVDWRELATNVMVADLGFIKVTGSAPSNEAGDCISAIAKFRTKSSAFVVSNGVKIEGVMANEALPEAFEVTRAFDVMAFINSNLDDAQRVAVQKLSEVVR